MSHRNTDVIEDDTFENDYESRKQVRANRRKDHRKLDRQGNDKRIKRVGSESSSNWKHNLRKYNLDDGDGDEDNDGVEE